MRNHKKYKKIWETYNKKELPKNLEIHHIDGNYNNNDPNNLLAVSIDEHLKIHLQQNDHSAVQAILMRMQRTEEKIKLLKESASKHQSNLFKNKKHNFQKKEIQEKRLHAAKKEHERRRKEGLGAFLGIHDTVKNGKNARNKMSREMELELASKMVDKIRGTFWWTNIETGEKIRAKNAPNDKWKRGMKL